MAKQNVVISYSLLAILFACGANDIGKTKRNGSGNDSGGSTQAAEAETNTGVMSQLHRNKGKTILTVAEEIEQILAKKLSSAYRVVPDIVFDNEGTQGKNVTFAERPTVSCGNSSDLEGINKRISNCKSENKTKATWDGGENGAAGESAWKLVYNDESKEPNMEIWFDSRTGLTWTSILSKTGNWCQATGNDQDRTTVGETGIACVDIRNGEDYCRALAPEGLDGDIIWRLPTRNDYLQADLDGIRFVFSPKNVGLWTATLVAGRTDNDFAWLYNDKTGVLSDAKLDTDQAIRCVGAPKK